SKTVASRTPRRVSPTLENRAGSASMVCWCTRSENGLQQLSHFGGIFRDTDAGRLHHCEFFLRRSLAAGDHRARVSHPLTRWRGHARNEADDRLFHMALRPLRSGLFVTAADLADHHDGIGFRIVVEELQHVDVLQTIYRIAADANRSRLAEAELR